MCESPPPPNKGVKVDSPVEEIKVNHSEVEAEMMRKDQMRIDTIVETIK
jgi:hypothetical protein